MKPIEKIKDIGVIDMGGGLNPGLPANTNGGGNGKPSNGALACLPHGGAGSLPDNIVQALMNYRMQAPLVDELRGELGFEPKAGLNGQVGSPSQHVKESGAVPNGSDTSSSAKSRGGPEDFQPPA